jgi:class 3 adenylate cyclase
MSSGIRYLKLVGQEAIAASGLSHEDRALAQLADAAIALRERFAAIFEELNQPRGFRIGIDQGSAVSCVLGDEPRVFNIWGNAVSTAHEMAATAEPGIVQVTEAAYDGLRREFLFRPRGRFYLPHFGEARTFALASRL